MNDFLSRSVPSGSSVQSEAKSVTTLARIGRTIGFDWHIALPSLVLTAFGLLMIYSTGGRAYFLRQLIFLPVALGGMLACYRIPRRLLYTFAYPLLAGAVVLLIAVLVLGRGPAQRWFNFGPVNFQPSEVAKIACVIALARFLADEKKMEFSARELVVPLALTLVLFGLVLVEPDLGSAMVFLPILGAMLYWRGMRLFHLFLLFAPVLSLIASFHIISWVVFFVLLGVVLFWQGRTWEIVYGFASNVLVGLLAPTLASHLHEYQKARVSVFLMPWLDPKGMGWNVIQSMIAVGSGRWLGKGLLAGTQKRLDFLPNRHTDFVFSCIAEEFGLVGALLVLGCFGFLCYRFLRAAAETKDDFASLLAFGLTAVFAYHVLVNTGMVLGLAPITGIALPFITYGGSPLLMNYMLIGLVLNVRYKPE